MLNNLSRQTKTILLLSLGSFFILGGYEFARSPSNILYQEAFGAKNLIWAITCVPFILGIIIYGYGNLITRIGPKRTLFSTTIGAASIIFISYIGIKSEIKFARAFFYVFREAYIVILVEQYWAFMNSIIDQEKSKKVIGIYTGFIGVGAVLGGLGVKFLSTSLGTLNLTLISASGLVIAAYFGNKAYQTYGEPKIDAASKVKHEGLNHLGVKFFKTTPFLIFLFLIIMTLQSTALVMNLHVQELISKEFTSTDLKTSYSGNMYAWTNFIMLVLQFAFIPVFFRIFNLKALHTLMPILILIAALNAIINPSLLSSTIALMTIKGIDYSLFRAAKEILYIPLPYDVRYRTKSVIDAFGNRFSQGFNSIILAILSLVGISLFQYYPTIMFISGLLWTVFLVKLISLYPYPETFKSKSI